MQEGISLFLRHSALYRSAFLDDNDTLWNTVNGNCLFWSTVAGDSVPHCMQQLFQFATSQSFQSRHVSIKIYALLYSLAALQICSQRLFTSIARSYQHGSATRSAGDNAGVAGAGALIAWMPLVLQANVFLYSGLRGM